MTSKERQARENLILSKRAVKAAVLVLAISWGFDFYAYGTWIHIGGFQTRMHCVNFKAEFESKLASPRVPPDPTAPVVQEPTAIPTLPDGDCAPWLLPPGPTEP